MARLFVKRKLTGREMIALENKLSSSLFAKQSFSCKEDLFSLAREYNLEVKEMEDKRHRAALLPSESDEFNGVICLKNSQDPSWFDFVHELVHYVFDVKIGNRVYEPLYEDFFDNKESDDPCEREVNYLAAAILMPYEEVQKRIKEYDSGSTDYNVLTFVRSLQQAFSVSRGCAIMRIQEVRKLMAMGY